jgi:tight adherence protein B
MSLILIIGLTFVTVGAFALAIAALVSARAQVRSRLAPAVPTTGVAAPSVIRQDHPPRFGWLLQLATKLQLMQSLDRLTEQAGWKGRSGLALGLIALFASVGGVLGAIRTNHWVGGIICAVVAGMLPILHLRYRRQKRLEKFSEQFPEALDMLTRALRTGYAVGASFQLVAEEMPDPVGFEFRRVFDQISLGRPTVEALQEMYDRIKTEDVRFFHVAVGIQREVGGNLAEILEKLAEVVRERYKLLAFAQTLSAQQRASAYCVAASPFVVALLLTLTSPGWFDPMWEWRYGMHVALGALGMQLVGFLVLRRIANITV